MSVLELVVDKIRKTYPDVMAIYVFGSFATEFETTQSDLDLAILCNEKIDSIALWNLSQEIAIEINKNVDLIDLLQASTILRFQVINDGKRIYCKNKTICDLFENKVDSEYLKFLEARVDLIKEIKQRGKITNG